MIEYLLRTVKDQSRKNKSLKDKIDAIKNPDGNRDATHGCTPAMPDLDAANIPPEASNKSRNDRLLEAPKISAIELFIHNREEPWNHFHLLFDAALIDTPRVAEENGWLPFWRSGASMRAFHRILPLNPLRSSLPFWRSCTSMLITEKSRIVETVASSQDLAALTDSTDTDTFESARSEFEEMVLDTYSLRLKGSEKDGPLAVFGDQAYFDTTNAVGKDDGRLRVANFHLSLDE